MFIIKIILTKRGNIMKKKVKINRLIICFLLFVISVMLRVFISDRIPDDIDESLVEKTRVSITSIKTSNSLGYSALKVSVDYNGEKRFITDDILHSEHYKLKFLMETQSKIEVYLYKDKLYYDVKNINTPSTALKSFLFIWFPLGTFFLTFISIVYLIIPEKNELH